MRLIAFSDKVKAYLKAAGFSQKMLANALGLDPSLLSHKLNGTGRTILTHPEVREIIKLLAQEEVITRQGEALELLALIDCPNFSQEAWKVAPLNKLELEQNTPSLPLIGTASRTASSTPVKSQSPLVTGTISTLQAKLAPLPDTLQSTTGAEPAHNLPPQLSSFIGRHKEVNDLKKLLAQEKARLVTLVGAGGCGKTRLSLQVAADLLDCYPDGVRFVELAALNDPALIPQTIAAALDLTEQAGRPVLAVVKDYLRLRHFLLVLDNCEHLVEECARVVDALIRTSARLHLLATSREALGLNGEVIFRIPSLTFPDHYILSSEVENLGDFEAVRLFIERAGADNPDFSLTSQNAHAVAQVCRELDGIPLAIELAAARLKVLTVEQLATRLADRFRLLRGGSRTALPRQQTLKALVDWSYDLLAETEKKLLARLSVFAGGWTLEAAEAVGGSPNVSGISSQIGLEPYEILDALTGLVNKSLVQVAEYQDNNAPRYHFLETIRQYGLEKLKASGEEREVRQRHLTYYVTLTAELVPKLQGYAQVELLEQWDRELDNIRAAIEHGLREEQVEAVFQLANNINHYMDTRGYYSEGRSYLEQALALPASSGVSRGITLFLAGLFALRQADLEAVRAFFEECLEVSKEHDNKLLQFRAFTGMGLMHLTTGAEASEGGSFSQSRWYFEQALTLSEEISAYAKSNALNNLGQVLVEQGEYEQARQVYDEGELIAGKMGVNWTLTMILINKARLALVMQDFEAAHHYLEDTWHYSEVMGFHYGKIDTLCYRGLAWCNEGKFGEARQALDKSLMLSLKGGITNLTGNGLVGVARLLSQVWQKRSEVGQPEKIACLGGAVWTLAGLSSPNKRFLTQPIQSYYEQVLAFARSKLDKAAFEKAFAQGQLMSAEEAISYARQGLSSL